MHVALSFAPLIISFRNKIVLLLCSILKVFNKSWSGKAFDKRGGQLLLKQRKVKQVIYIYVDVCSRKIL